MAELTQEELDFLEENKDTLNSGTLAVTPAQDDPVEMDPELAEYLKRNPSIDLSRSSLDPDNKFSPIPGTGAISINVTPEISSAREEQDALTFQGLYGEKPDNPLTERVINTVAPDEDSAAAVEAYDKAMDEWVKNANEVYESTGFMRNNQKQYVKTVPVTDEDGNTVWEEKFFLIPAPTGGDSIAIARSLEQAGRDIYQSVGGLLTTGSFLEESELERNVADYDQRGGEALLTTMLGVAAPAVGVASKAKKYAGKLTKGGSLGTKSAITVDAVSTALVESIMAQEGSEGLIIKPSVLEPIFGKEGAKDVSIFLDGMFLNGTLDSMITVLGAAGRFVGNKASATRRLANQEVLRKAVTDDSMAGALNYLDPKLVNSSPAEAKRRIYLLAEKMEQASVIELTLGQASAKIAADTPTTMLRMSEAYVREADQNLLSTMSKEEFDEYVVDEAARMSTAMINLMRGRMADPMVQNAASRTQNEIGAFLQGAAKENLPDGFTSVDDAAQSAAGDIVRSVDGEVAGLTAQADDLTRQTDDLLAAQRTVVEDNPIVMDLVGDTNVFGSDLSSYRQAVQEVFSGDLYVAFKQTFDEVDAAYKNLPDAAIDAGLLKDQLSQVVKDANVMDSSGRRAAAVLRDILEPFTAKAKAASGDENFVPFGLDLDKAVNTKESIDEVLDRVTSEIRFQDLYQIKANMSKVIDRYRNEPAVQQRLIALRNHITNAETGQIASIARTQPEVAEEYLKADALFKEAKAKFSNSDQAREIERRLADRRRFDTERGEIPGPFGRGEPDTITGGDNLANQVIGDTTGTLDKQVKFMLDGIRSPEDLDGVFGDLFVAEAAQDLRQRLLVAGENGQTEEIIASAFLPYQQRLKDVGATQTLDQLRTAFDQVKDARQNLGDMALFNEESLKQINDQIVQAQEGVVGKLISSIPGSPRGLDGQGPSRLVPRSDAALELEKIMSGPDSVNAVRALNDRIALLPEGQRLQAQGALQAVAINSVGKKIFGATDVSVRDKTINLGKINKLTSNEADNLLKSFDALFGASDDQLLMKDLLLEALDALEIATKPQRVKASQSGSDSIINAQRINDMRDAASTGILVFAGYMNPTAAMLRRMASMPIKEAEELQKQVTAMTLNVIVTDPNSFAKYARAYVDGQPDSVIRQIAQKGSDLTYRTSREEMRVQEPEDPAYFDLEMLQALGLAE